MNKETIEKMRVLSAEKKENPENLRIAAKENLVQQFLNTEVDVNSIEKVHRAGNVLADIEGKYNNEDIQNKTPDDLLTELKGQFEEKQIDALVEDCKMTALDAIIGPFGLSHDLFQDKDGGNVTTIHNATNGVYANDNDKYDRKKYKYGNALDSYRDKRETPGGKIRDEYTGETINVKDSAVDHVISLDDYHTHGGYMQTDQQRSDFAKDERNHAITNSKSNSSKREQDLKEFEQHIVQGETDNNKTRFGIDDRRANAKYKKAIAAAQEHLPGDTEKVQYYAKQSAKTGIGAGVRMGLQQAIGLLLRELALGIFDEVKDIYHHGLRLNDQNVFHSLKIRVNSVANRIKAKWKDYLFGLKDGAIFGFISNFATTLINIFVTTEAKFVKMVREGAMSLYQAGKILIHHPSEMTLAEAAHESSKLVVAGLGVSMGIIIEDALQGLAWLTSGPLAPFSTLIASVISSLVTGIITLLAVYMLDKIDLFGVNQKKQQDFITKSLNTQQDSNMQEAKEYSDIINDF